MDKARFENIYSFYKFDKSLSYLFLSYILDLESSFKTSISHVVSSKGNNGHKEEFYLDQSIFQDHKQKTEEELRDDKNLLNSLKEKIKNSNKLYIKHNRELYNNVPFWVLCNDMNFGETIYYFEKLPEKDRNKVSLIMRDENEEVKLTLKQFKSALYMLKDLRNLIAHNEVFYWFEPIKYNGKNRWYGFNHYKSAEAQKGSIAAIVLIFNMYLLPDHWTRFYSSFRKECLSFSEKIPEEIFQEILNKMLNKEYGKDFVSLEDLDRFYK